MYRFREIFQAISFNDNLRNVDDVKKKLVKKKKQGKTAREDEPRTLQVPSHRLVRERIEGSIAYSDIRYYLCLRYL